MALLDSVSLYSNVTTVTKWANGKFGLIVPTRKETYVFVEHEYKGDMLICSVKEQEWDEKCPVLAHGFVTYWLMHRARKSDRAKRLDVFVPKERTMAPMEIFDSYIAQLKSRFFEMMKKRPDAWKYPDLEKTFYETVLTRDYEAKYILQSEPLLDYLDEEDKMEFVDMMKNFLDYVSHIVEPYQHVIEKAARQKRIEENRKAFEDIIARAEEEESKFPHPKPKTDNKKYNIGSPEIYELALQIDALQFEILHQLVTHKDDIPDWKDNEMLNQFTNDEIREAVCPLVEENLVIAFMEVGIVSHIRIKDKGKLVLRKYKSLPQESQPIDSFAEHANKKVSPIEVPGEYKNSVKAVFIETVKVNNEKVQTFPSIVNAFQLCVAPNSAPQIAVFIQACIAKKCAKKAALDEPTSVVKALIGLGLIEVSEEEEQKKKEIKNLATNIGRKIRNSNGKPRSKADKEVFYNVQEELSFQS